VALARRVCANHPERAAHAVCMSCRKNVCGECATEWDGINYCVTCLAARRLGERRGSALLAGFSALLACALLFALSAELMVWFGALLGGFL
jgi:hypothetical protein